MRLTETIRDSFVRAAMNDVPCTNYDEQMNKLLIADAVKQLPPAVRKLWDNETTRLYINTSWCSRYGATADVPVAHGTRFEPTPEVAAELERLYALNKAQNETHSELHRKLYAAAKSVSTRKALVALLPEFEKYLPADEQAACKTLPAIANVVADFTKAGWPKGTKK